MNLPNLNSPTDQVFELACKFTDTFALESPFTRVRQAVKITESFMAGDTFAQALQCIGINVHSAEQDAAYTEHDDQPFMQAYRALRNKWWHYERLREC